MSAPLQRKRWFEEKSELLTNHLFSVFKGFTDSTNTEHDMILNTQDIPLQLTQPPLAFTASQLALQIKQLTKRNPLVMT